jgi:preprotein translocase subunit Sec63
MYRVKEQYGSFYPQKRFLYFWWLDFQGYRKVHSHLAPIWFTRLYTKTLDEALAIIEKDKESPRKVKYHYVDC